MTTCPPFYIITAIVLFIELRLTAGETSQTQAEELERDGDVKIVDASLVMLESGLVS